MSRLGRVLGAGLKRRARAKGGRKEEVSYTVLSRLAIKHQKRTSDEKLRSECYSLYRDISMAFRPATQSSDLLTLACPVDSHIEPVSAVSMLKWVAGHAWRWLSSVSSRCTWQQMLGVAHCSQSRPMVVLSAIPNWSPTDSASCTCQTGQVLGDRLFFSVGQLTEKGLVQGFMSVAPRRSSDLIYTCVQDKHESRHG